MIGPEARLALGREIRRIRRSRGLTQAQLADPLSRAYVCSVEHGRTTPSLASLVMFATRLGVPAGDLVGTLETHAVPASTRGFTVS